MGILGLVGFGVAAMLLYQSPEAAAVWDALQEKGFHYYFASFVYETSTGLKLSLVLLVLVCLMVVAKSIGRRNNEIDLQDLEDRLTALEEASAPEGVTESVEPLDQDPQTQVAALLGEIARVEGRVRALQAMGHGDMATQLGNMLASLRTAQSAAVPLAGQIQEMHTLCRAVEEMLRDMRSSLNEVERFDMPALVIEAGDLEVGIAQLKADVAEQQTFADKLLALKATLTQLDSSFVLVDGDGAPLEPKNKDETVLESLVRDVEGLQAEIRGKLEEVDLDSLLDEQTKTMKAIEDFVAKINQLSRLADALRPAAAAPAA